MCMPDFLPLRCYKWALFQLVLKWWTNRPNRADNTQNLWHWSLWSDIKLCTAGLQALTLFVFSYYYNVNIIIIIVVVIITIIITTTITIIITTITIIITHTIFDIIISIFLLLSYYYFH